MNELEKVGDFWFRRDDAKRYRELIESPQWEMFNKRLDQANLAFVAASSNLRSKFEYWQSLGFSKYDIYRNHQFIELESDLARIGAERKFLEEVRFTYLKPFMDAVMPAPCICHSDGRLEIM